MNQPAFQGVDVVYKGKADNKDIRDLLEKLVPKASEQMKGYAQKFKGKTELQTCKNIFNFLKNDLTYIADKNEQIIKLPSALLSKKVGDCKSYSLFTASVLDNLQIPYTITYASYNENPIPQHVYIVTKSGIIIDAVYGIFNQEKKPKYKYKKNMNVRYMAGIDDNSGMGLTIISKEKRDQFKNYTKEQLAQAEANAKALRDKALKEAEIVKAQAQAKARQLENYAKEQRDKLAQGSKTIGLSGGRALFLLIIQNNFDGFATKLNTGNVAELMNGWYKLGGDRTKLANALKIGASKPEKKLGFLPKLNAIYDKARINGMGAVDPNEKAQTLPSQSAPDNVAKQQFNEAIAKYKMDGSIQGLIGGLCTSVGAVIGSAIGPPHGTAIGGGAGATLGTIVIALTPVIVNAVRKTAKTNNPDAPLTPPSIDPTSKGDINSEFDKPSVMPSNNTLLYVGGGLLVATGIYFATKKK
jgi:hypothetical protein